MNREAERKERRKEGIIEVKTRSEMKREEERNARGREIKLEKESE